MAKKSQETQKQPYDIKTAVVRCSEVYNGESFRAIWKVRKNFRLHEQNVLICLAKVICPGSNGMLRAINKGGTELDAQQMQSMLRSEPGAAEATVFLRKIEGKDVLIEYAQYPNGEIIKDALVRIIAMVFTRNAFGLKGENLGLSLVRQGYARVYTSKSSENSWSTPAYDKQFQEAYKDAEDHRRGIHRNLPKHVAQRAVNKSTLASYVLIGFVFGFLIGFLVCAVLLGVNVTPKP